jgi:Galactosyltransferase
MFFVGGDDVPQREDEVVLPVDDSYAGLPDKVRHVMRWAITNGYDAVLKVDDDVFVIPKRIPDYENLDYVGNFRMRNGNYPYDYASGFAYWLGGKALKHIAEAELTDDTMEDRWVGNTLAVKHNIRCFDEKRFACTYPQGIDEAKFLWGSPIGKTHAVFAQYPAHKMYDMNHWYMRCFDVVLS